MKLVRIYVFNFDLTLTRNLTHFLVLFFLNVHEHAFSPQLEISSFRNVNQKLFELNGVRIVGGAFKSI